MWRQDQDNIYDAGLGPRISLYMFMVPHLMAEGGREFQDVSAAQLNDRLPTTTVLYRKNILFSYINIYKHIYIYVFIIFLCALILF